MVIDHAIEKRKRDQMDRVFIVNLAVCTAADAFMTEKNQVVELFDSCKSENCSIEEARSFNFPMILSSFFLPDSRDCLCK